MHGTSVARTFALALFAAPLFAGCGGSVTSRAQDAALAVPPTQVALSDEASPDIIPAVGMRLSGEKPFKDPSYGRVDGYFKGRKSLKSQVVTLSANTKVVFVNVEFSMSHTASFLGDATASSAPWPSSFTGSQTQSKAGTAIGTTNWSTGSLSPGQKSLIYNTGGPGFYMIGCSFHYLNAGMRTVIIVM